MTVTSNTIANQAIFLIGGNTPPVTGFAPTFDNSTAGVALHELYAAAVVTPTEMHVYYAQRLRGVSPEGQKGKPAISGLTRDNPA